jgi:hypothetical protein
MPEDDGLPLPAPPPWRPPPIARTEDLDAGHVDNGLRDLLRAPAGATGDALEGVFSAVPVGSWKPTFRHFRGRGTDALAHVESVMEEAVGSDPSLAGTLKAVVGAFATGFFSPVAAITDGIVVPGIEKMQGEFFQRHQSDLRNLSLALSHAKRVMLDLGDLLSRFNPKALRPEEILNQKRRAGRAVYDQLVDALDAQTDPAERARLQAQKDQMDTWFKDVDERIAREQPQIDDLQRRTLAVFQEAGRQSALMEEAGLSDGPGNVTASETDTTNRFIIDTTHTRPDAVRHVGSLREFLVQSRIQMNGALAGRK